jgi:Dolichyl-phosphate-mannose-protein mannosyltransferase
VSSGRCCAVALPELGYALRGRFDRWSLLVIGALAARAALIPVLALTQVVPHNGWYWANKDQLEYYGFAHALLHGGVAQVYTFMGYGVLLAPLVVGSDFVLQAVPAVAIVQALLAVPAAVLLWGAGTRLMERRAAAVGTALWLTTPLWLSPIWFRSYSAPFNVATYWLGIQVSPDYASALLAIGVLYVGAGARSDGSIRRGCIVGVLAGLAFLAKPSNVIIVASAVAALLVWRRWGAAIAAAAVSAVVFSAQIVLNWRINGDPAKFQYSTAWPYGDAKPLASIAYVPRTFGKLVLLNYTGPLLFIAALAALVITWRRYPSMRVWGVAQVVGFALFFSPLYYSISEFMLRFMTPALPALCLAAGGALVKPATAARRWEVSAPGRASVAFWGAAVAGAAVLAVFIGLAPLRSVLPEVRSMAPRGEKVGHGRVAVTWQAPSASMTLAYQAFRSREGDPTLAARLIWGGVRRRFTDRPGAGTWLYRLYVTPGYHPGGLPPGPAFAVAPPLKVVLSG